MASLKSVELEVEGTKDLALIAADDSIWLVVPLKWWDLATIAWWLFCPSDRKGKVKLTVKDPAHPDGQRVVNFFAVRVASRHIRVRGLLK